MGVNIDFAAKWHRLKLYIIYVTPNHENLDSVIILVNASLLVHLLKFIKYIRPLIFDKDREKGFRSVTVVYVDHRWMDTFQI